VLQAPDQGMVEVALGLGHILLAFPCHGPCLFPFLFFFKNYHIQIIKKYILFPALIFIRFYI
jgi:hypothetical protein